MKFYFILISIVSIFSISCTSYDEMLTALESKQGIDKLKKGMDYSKVTELAGNPYKKSFTSDSTEVWIYVTAIPQTAFSQSPDKLSNDYKTAVLFRDKQLIGWGDEVKGYIN